MDMLIEQTRLQICRTAHALDVLPAEARTLTQGDVRRLKRVRAESSGQPHTRRAGPGEQHVKDQVLGREGG